MSEYESITPMLSLGENLRMKLEHLNPGGSHKTRAARRIIIRAIENGDLTPGGPRRILEKSGGNFGVGLAYEAAKYKIGVDLVIGLSFSPIKRALCEEYGARLVGVDLLHEGLQPKEVIARLLEERPDSYFFTNQFANPANLEAHLIETGPEIVSQIRHEVNDFNGITLVMGAGTGAHAQALISVLKSHFENVELVIVQPENCIFEKGEFGDHVQQGAGVGVVPPFLDFSDVTRIESVLDVDASEGQCLLAEQAGIYPGPTGGANYYLASQIAHANPDRLVVTMTYDAGEGYLAQKIYA